MWSDKMDQRPFTNDYINFQSSSVLIGVAVDLPILEEDRFWLDTCRSLLIVLKLWMDADDSGDGDDDDGEDDHDDDPDDDHHHDWVAVISCRRLWQRWWF